MIFQFGEYKIDVDVEKTKQFYNRAVTVRLKSVLHPDVILGISIKHPTRADWFGNFIDIIVLPLLNCNTFFKIHTHNIENAYETY